MTTTKRMRHVAVTGGAGYVGSALVPKLLDAGHNVTVLDLYLYGDPGLQRPPRPPRITRATVSNNYSTW